MLYRRINIILLLIINIDISYSQGKSNHLEGRIVGGRPVSIEKYPTAVQFFNLGSLCAGSILNSWSVLTSAHCVDINKNVNEMMVQAGTRFVYDFGATMYTVVQAVVHEEYNKSAQFACDIALVFVNGPIKLGKLSQKAVLVNTNKWMRHEENHFIVTGWGLTNYTGETSKLGLLTTHLHYVPVDECSQLHTLNMTSDMFCLYGDATRDTCKGDSGGGVTWNGFLVGITSHGNGCAKENKPSIYTNVWVFKKWIEAHVKRFFSEYCSKYYKQYDRTF